MKFSKILPRSIWNDNPRSPFNLGGNLSPLHLHHHLVDTNSPLLDNAWKSKVAKDEVGGDRLGLLVAARRSKRTFIPLAEDGKEMVVSMAKRTPGSGCQDGVSRWYPAFETVMHWHKVHLLTSYRSLVVDI